MEYETIIPELPQILEKRVLTETDIFETDFIFNYFVVNDCFEGNQSFAQDISSVMKNCLEPLRGADLGLTITTNSGVFSLNLIKGGFEDCVENNFEGVDDQINFLGDLQQKLNESVLFLKLLVEGADEEELTKENSQIIDFSKTDGSHFANHFHGFMIERNAPKYQPNCVGDFYSDKLKEAISAVQKGNPDLNLRNFEFIISYDEKSENFYIKITNSDNQKDITFRVPHLDEIKSVDNSFFREFLNEAFDKVLEADEEGIPKAVSPEPVQEEVGEVIQPPECGFVRSCPVEEIFKSKERQIQPITLDLSHENVVGNFRKVLTAIEKVYGLGLDFEILVEAFDDCLLRAKSQYLETLKISFNTSSQQFEATLSDRSNSIDFDFDGLANDENSLYPKLTDALKILKEKNKPKTESSVCKIIKKSPDENLAMKSRINRKKTNLLTQ